MEENQDNNQDQIRKSRNDKKLNLSNKRFKRVSNSNNKKFEMLPNWLDNVSYRYDQECTGKFPRDGYYHYKRGSIIRVDFGVNMGSEFSFPHFAVVLDKKDNSRKRTLTVVPLTSKDKSDRLPLGKEIFVQTIQILQRKMEEIKKQTTDENNARLQIDEKLYNYAKSIIDQLLEYDDAYKNEFVDFYVLPHDTEKIIPNIQKVSNILSSLPTANKPSIAANVDELLKIAKESDKLSKNINLGLKNIQEHKKVLDIYAKYNHDSFARISDITTISKFRIKRINKMDPSGEICLDDSKMKLISDKIMELYITK
ncbi:type II toxin-antitoxin system PemK/MazF family toxin [Companilactobacillus futsaii]|uniref:type II toxin-antitoxin system PemK/MazF family toxin n=1 Tax=Companilactobacillus futsaii TaxID=938155 RepID=UPI00189FB0FA|nr:type II toxin-antitoxin system PemK/MazF family toxin [Companilactobacillus futsaii]